MDELGWLDEITPDIQGDEPEEGVSHEEGKVAPKVTPTGNDAIYSKLVAEGLLDELGEDDLDEDEDKLTVAISKLRQLNEAQPVKLFKAAFEKAGGDFEQYSVAINRLENIKNINVANLAPADVIDKFTALRRAQAAISGEDVTSEEIAAEVEALSSRGILETKFSKIQQVIVAALEANKTKLENSWSAAQASAMEKFQAENKPVDDYIDSVKTVLGITLTDDTKTKYKKILAPKVDKNSSAKNITNSSELSTLLADKENLVRLAALIDAGVFNKKTKFNLAATAATVPTKGTTPTEELDIDDILASLK